MAVIEAPVEVLPEIVVITRPVLAPPHTGEWVNLSRARLGVDAPAK